MYILTTQYNLLTLTIMNISHLSFIYSSYYNKFFRSNECKV